MTPKQVSEFLLAHDNYLILTHIRPDGDTIGCAAGLCRALREQGKTAHILPNPEATAIFTPYLEVTQAQFYIARRALPDQPEDPFTDRDMPPV